MLRSGPRLLGVSSWGRGRSTARSIVIGEHMGDFREYHKALTSELEAAKGKLANLVEHWASVGALREAVFRSVLRRHLPDSVAVGSGFVVDRGGRSTQLDILVTRPHKPFLFRDGDVLVVTPDVPAVIVEVKTRLRGEKEWGEAIDKLASVYGAGRQGGPKLGLFCYDGDIGQAATILNSVALAYDRTGVVIDWVCSGPSLFVRYWGEWEIERLDDSDGAYARWRAYSLQGVAPSYFVGNAVEAVCADGEVDGAWFAYDEGKFSHLLMQRFVGAHPLE